MSTMLHDLRQGSRVFVKSPGFTLAVLATLALGIGANTALFTVINTVLLHPLPYPDSSRIVDIARRAAVRTPYRCSPFGSETIRSLRI